jgi:hypothetical protein
VGARPGNGRVRYVVLGSSMDRTALRQIDHDIAVDRHATNPSHSVRVVAFKPLRDWRSRAPLDAEPTFS